MYLLYPFAVRTVGGEIGAASALAPKVGPLGLVRTTSTELR